MGEFIHKHKSNNKSVDAQHTKHILYMAKMFKNVPQMAVEKQIKTVIYTTPESENWRLKMNTQYTVWNIHQWRRIVRISRAKEDVQIYNTRKTVKNKNI